MSVLGKPVVRAAVYTRKSSDEGLDQEFNSLDGAVRLSSPSISIGLSTLFYEITKERHSVRATSRLNLKVLRFESDLCELNKL